MIQFSAPVAFAAMGEAVVQRSGVLNIGLEGIMLASAFFAAIGSYFFHSPAWGLVSGAFAAVVLTSVVAFLTVSRGLDQVVVGTGINLLALGLTGTLYRNLFGQTGSLITVPRIAAWNGLDPLVILMVCCGPLLAYLLSGTGWGLALRAAGQFPAGVEAAGFSVPRLRWQAMLLGGFFAALGGCYLTLVITGTFTENMTAGRGFIAIAVVTFARWHPIWALISAVGLGLAGSSQFWLQTKGFAIPYQLFVASPYLLALLVLVLIGKGSRAPAALGLPYQRRIS